MKNKNWPMVIILLLFGTLLLVACDDSQPEEADEEETAAEPTTEETAAEVVAAEEGAQEEAAASEVSLTIWADETRAPILLDLADEFQAAYGAGLIVEQTADPRNDFLIAAPAGEGPDILIGVHDWLGQFVASGLVASIDLGDKADAFTEVTLDGFTYEGQLYGLPYAIENMAFFYNTELVSNPPATWQEVVEIGAALQESGDVTYGFGLTGTTYDAFPLQTAFGGYIFGVDADGNYDPSDVGVDSEGMIAAGDWIAEQISSGFMSQNTDWDTTHSLFETGEIPFLMAGPWALARIRESGVPYAITNFPGGGRPFASVQGFMINAFSENALLAQAFLVEFVATDATMQALSEAGNRPSAFVPVVEAMDDPDLFAFGEAGSTAVLMPAIPEMGVVWIPWSDAFGLIINGDQSADEALANSARQIRALIGGS